MTATPPDPGNALLRLLGFVMMTCGALVAAFTGLCAGILLVIQVLAKAKNLDSDVGGMLLVFVVASATVWLGWRVYRRGGGG